MFWEIIIGMLILLTAFVWTVLMWVRTPEIENFLPWNLGMKSNMNNRMPYPQSQKRRIKPC